jgi:hypothetical protein
MSTGKSSKRRKRGPKKGKLGGEFGFTVPEAGSMVGLGRNASYEAAKKGEIPIIEFGALKIVPRVPWLRKLGVEEKI